jgi:hypothetical protein
MSNSGTKSLRVPVAQSVYSRGCGLDDIRTVTDCRFGKHSYFFESFLPGPAAHGCIFFSGCRGIDARSVKLTSRLLLILRLRMHGSVAALPSCRAERQYPLYWHVFGTWNVRWVQLTGIWLYDSCFSVYCSQSS